MKTATDLIAQLQQLPPGTPVLVLGQGMREGCLCDLDSVELIDAVLTDDANIPYGDPADWDEGLPRLKAVLMS